MVYVFIGIAIIIVMAFMLGYQHIYQRRQGRQRKEQLNNRLQYALKCNQQARVTVIQK